MQWITFFTTLIISLPIILLPGAVLLFALGVRGVFLSALSPCGSVVIYSLLGILLHHIGISCSGWLLFFLACLLTILILLLRFALKSFAGSDPSSERGCLGGRLNSCERWRTYSYYCLFAIIITLYLFIIPLDGPDSFSSSSDNAFHLSLVREFMDSGVWCMLHSTTFPEFANSGAFYPASWHVLVSLIVEIFGCSVPAGANIVNTIILAVFVPSGYYLLLGCLFGWNTRLHIIGSFACLSFAAFPWGFINWGQLAPLMMAFSFVPMFVFMFQSVLRQDSEYKKSQIVVLLLVTASIVFAHPSAVFTAGIFAVPIILRFIDGLIQKRTLVLRDHHFSVSLLIVLVPVSVIWLFFYSLPALSATVSYQWEASDDLLSALSSVLTFCFGGLQAPQFLLGVVVIIGLLRSLRSSRFRNLVCLYAFFFFLVIVNSTTNSEIRHVLTGFWYTDPYRIGAMLAISAVPLACLGFDWIGNFVAYLLFRGKKNSLQFVCFGVCVALAALIFSPNFTEPGGKEVRVTGFGRMRDHMAFSYSQNSKYSLDSDEMKFLEEVREITNGARIINCPYDGSMYAYGIMGLNVQYRAFLRSASEADSLPGELDEIAFNQEVMAQVDEIGARYVMLLDSQWPKSGSVDANGDVEAWRGLYAINESVPGFKLVLSEGDMRLFEIIG